MAFETRTVSGNMDTRTRSVSDHIVFINCCLLFLNDPLRYDQAHPLSCAAAIAVQKVIAAENLLENGRQTGQYPAELLCKRLQRPGALAQPFMFDMWGRGSFWVVELITCCDCLRNVVEIMSEKCDGSGNPGTLR
jgi:hypothetical protein